MKRQHGVKRKLTPSPLAQKKQPTRRTPPPLCKNQTTLSKCDFEVWHCGYPIGKVVMEAVFEGCEHKELTAKTTEAALRSSTQRGGIWFTSGGTILCNSAAVERVARSGMTVVNFDVEHGANFFLTPKPKWNVKPKKIVYLGVNDSSYVTKNARDHWGFDIPASRQLFVSVAAATFIYGHLKPSQLLTLRNQTKRNHFLIYAQDRDEVHRQKSYDAIVDFAKSHGLPAPVALGLCYGKHPETWAPSVRHDNVLSIDNKRSARFILTMENFLDIPGRITEKLIDAYLAGAIPVYAGPPGVELIFNMNALVWLDPRHPGPGLERLLALETNSSLYEEVLREPLLVDGMNTINDFFSLRSDLGNGSLQRRIRDLVDCVRKAPPH